MAVTQPGGEGHAGRTQCGNSAAAANSRTGHDTPTTRQLFGLFRFVALIN